MSETQLTAAEQMQNELEEKARLRNGLEALLADAHTSIKQTSLSKPYNLARQSSPEKWDCVYIQLELVGPEDDPLAIVDNCGRLTDGKLTPEEESRYIRTYYLPIRPFLSTDEFAEILENDLIQDLRALNSDIELLNEAK